MEPVVASSSSSPSPVIGNLPERKVDYRDEGITATERDLGLLAEKLHLLADTRATSLLHSHIDGVLLQVREGKLQLRGEDLDILRPSGAGAELLRNERGQPLSIDRNIAHLYFSSDSTFSKHYDPAVSGHQLLHGVADAMVRKTDGDVLCIQWVHRDVTWRNLGIIGGHVPTGMLPIEAAKKEIPEELGWVGKLPAHYQLKGAFRVLGEVGEFPAPNPGDAEAKTLSEYILSDANELRLVLEEQAQLAELLDQLGAEQFYRNRLELQTAHPGHGEIWAIHFLSPKDLQDQSLLSKLNLGVDLRAYLAHETVRRELFN